MVFPKFSSEKKNIVVPYVSVVCSNVFPTFFPHMFPSFPYVSICFHMGVSIMGDPNSWIVQKRELPNEKWMIK